MEISVRVEQEYFRSAADEDDDTQSYMDEEDVREVRLHHWLTETAVSARLAQDSAPALARADSPLLLGFDHQLPQLPDSESDKPLPSRPTLLSRLRSHSTAAPTPAPAIVVAGTPLHRRSPSHSQFSSVSHSPAISRRPSLARQPSLPLLAESEPIPSSTLLSARQSSRLHSISSSLSLSSGRNAVYIDSEEIRSRLDQLLISGHSGLDHDDAQDLNIDDFYLTGLEKEQDSPTVDMSTPPSSQRVPPNTPMTAFFKTPCASSSQIYLGKTTAPFAFHAGEDTRTELPRTGTPVTALSAFKRAPDATVDASPMELEDVRATPVPHARLLDVDHSAPAVSSSPSESESVEGSPIFSIATSTTSRTSSSVSQLSGVSPQPNLANTLSSKASMASLSQAAIVPKRSLNSIGLGYQVPSPNSSMLSPPPATASRWSLTSSLAGDLEKEKKKKEKKDQKEKGATRKRFASLMSKISGNGSGKEDSAMADQQKESRDSTPTTDLSSRDEDSEIPVVPSRPKSRPPSLKLALSHSHSISNLRSTIVSSPSAPLSPVSARFSPTAGSFVTTTLTSASAAGVPAATSVVITGAATPSPPLPNVSIQSEAQLYQLPSLKSVASVPAFLPGWEGPGFLRREDSAGWSARSAAWGSDSTPASPVEDDDEEEDEIDDGADFYIRELGLTASTFGSRRDEAEEERKARLSVINDMLERDLNVPAKSDRKASGGSGGGGLFYRSKRAIKAEEKGVVLDISRGSPAHFRKSSGADRTPSPTQTRRSAPSPAPRSPITPTPSVLSSGKNSLRTLAARIGISNSNSYTPFVSSPAIPNGGADSPSLTSKHKTLGGLISSGSKRKAQKRRLVISGVGDDASEVAAIRSWCDSLGEVRSMVKVKSVQGEVTMIGQGDGCGQNVWVVDFKKGSVAERVCRLQAKVEIKGAGSVRLSWETKPKVGFNIVAKGWVP